MDKETEMEMEAEKKQGFARLTNPFTDFFGLSNMAATVTVVMIIVLVTLTVVWFIYSAPPHKIIISSGPPGSTFETNAVSYRDFLQSNGITVELLPSLGSSENLRRLAKTNFQVDVAFVQGGTTNLVDKSKLVSLGSVSYQPLLIFYRSSNTCTMLSEFRGKKLAVGPVGSGTRTLARALFALNGMPTNGPTLFDFDAQEAANALISNRVDVVFLMGDSASREVMVQLLHAPNIQLFSFAQADGYIRRISYLNKLVLPMGSIDFGKNIPTNDVYLIGPTVELLARSTLHPGLIDLLIEAAQQVNGTCSLLKKKGEFPTPIENDFKISLEAARFYKSGRPFLYRTLGFTLASLVNRILVAFVPLVVILIPVVKLIPAIYKWRIRMLIYRRYRALLAIEREISGPMKEGSRGKLVERLDNIEKAVNKMKLPASFGDQFYGLRGHISFVRNRLTEETH